MICLSHIAVPVAYYVMPYEEMEEETGETPTEDPWLYLKPMFEIFVTKTDSFQFKCLLCLPQTNYITAYKNSSSNLKKYVVVK